MSRSAAAIFLIWLIAIGSARAQSVPDMLYLRFEERGGTTTTDWATPGSGATGSLTPGTSFFGGTAPLGNGGLATGPQSTKCVVLTNLVVPATIDFSTEFWVEVGPYSPFLAGPAVFSHTCSGTNFEFGLYRVSSGAIGGLFTASTTFQFIPATGSPPPSRPTPEIGCTCRSFSTAPEISGDSFSTALCTRHTRGRRSR